MSAEGGTGLWSVKNRRPKEETAVMNEIVLDETASKILDQIVDLSSHAMHKKWFEETLLTDPSARTIPEKEIHEADNPLKPRWRQFNIDYPGTKAWVDEHIHIENMVRKTVIHGKDVWEVNLAAISDFSDLPPVRKNDIVVYLKIAGIEVLQAVARKQPLDNAFLLKVGALINDKWTLANKNYILMKIAEIRENNTLDSVTAESEIEKLHALLKPFAQMPKVEQEKAMDFGRVAIDAYYQIHEHKKKPLLSTPKETA